jgi:hypothetical protein
MTMVVVGKRGRGSRDIQGFQQTLGILCQDNY